MLAVKESVKHPGFAQVKVGQEQVECSAQIQDEPIRRHKVNLNVDLISLVNVLDSERVEISALIR